MLVANMFGPDALIVLAVIALLFGGSQLPKLARSLGSASHEFRRGVEEGGPNSSSGSPESGKDAKPTTDEERSGS